MVGIRCTGTLVAAAMAVVAAVQAQEAPAQEAPKEPARFSVIGPPGNVPSYTAVVAPFWTETMPEISGGMITATVTDVLSLGLSGAEVFRLNRQGVADVVTGSGTYASGDLPVIDGTDLAGVSQDIDTFRRAADAFIPYVNEQMVERMGVKVVAVFPTVGQVMFCAVPIGSLEDLAGKKVRVSGATLSDLIDGLGATPVTMPFAEVVPALQRGTIDCGVTGATVGNIAKWTEVTTHVVPLLTGWSLNLTTVNLERWNALPDATRAFLEHHLVNTMDAQGWEMAAVTTDHGLWCTTGDERCNPEPAPGVVLDRLDLTLVELTPEDDARRLELIRTHVLPGFKERCGEVCAERWNETVGVIVGLQIE